MASKFVIVKNIGNDITEQDLIDILGLAKTDGLKGQYQITVIHGAEERSACIEIPDAFFDMVMKLNGVNFKGKDLVLTSSDSTKNDINADTMVNGEAETEEEPEEDPIQYLELDTRIPEWNFNQVTDFEIVEAIEEEFPDDFSKSVEDLGRYSKEKDMQGIFRVDSDDYSPYKGRTLTIRDKEIAFRPKYKRKSEHGGGYSEGIKGSGRNGRQEGTLITIYGAFRKPHRHINHDEFDDYFTNIQVNIIKPTEPQVRKHTSVLNNNRYLVVQKLDGDDDTINHIRNSIVVHGKNSILATMGRKRIVSCVKEPT